MAWFALAPGEPWHQHHAGWSPRYYEQVNRYVYIDRSVGIHNTYINYRAPATPFVRGQPLRQQPYAIDPAHWRNPRNRRDTHAPRGFDNVHLGGDAWAGAGGNPRTRPRRVRRKRRWRTSKARRIRTLRRMRHDLR